MATKSADMIQHADKIALGVGAVLMAGMIAMGVLSGGDSAKIEKAGDQIRQIEALAETADKALQAPTLDRRPHEEFRALLDRKFEPVTPPAWAMHARPLILRKVDEKPPEVVCIHEPPLVDDPVVERGKITLSWSDDADNNSKVDIVRYTVYRGVDLDTPEDHLDEFSKVKELAGDIGRMSWTDENVVPERRYAYYVLSEAEPSGIAKSAVGGFKFPPETREQRSRVTNNVSTPSNHTIWLNKVTPDDPDFPDPERDQIEFAVCYWDAATNEWSRRKTFRGVIGSDPETKPVTVGEGPYETQWILWRVDAEEVGVLPGGGAMYKRFAEVKHKLTGEVRTFVEGEKPPGF